MLQISRDYGSIALTAPTEEKASQTEDPNLNDSDTFNSSLSSVLGISQMSMSDDKQQELIATNHINNNNNNNNHTTTTASSTFTSSVNINVNTNAANPPSKSASPNNSTKSTTADAAS